MQEARQDLAAWLAKWGKRYAKVCAWAEENIEAKFSFYRLPRQHHKNLKSTDMLERLVEKIKRRTLVVRIFPDAAACLRLVRASAVETHENWIEAMQYLKMEPLREQKKKRCGSWDMRRDGFYLADQGKALPSRPRPRLAAGIKGPVCPNTKLQDLASTTITHVQLVEMLHFSRMNT